MSGGLPPFTAVSTFCSVSSLLTYSDCTFCPGCCASYSETRWENVLASWPVPPSQIWIVLEEEADPDDDDPPPFASVPQPATASADAVSAAISPARAPRRCCLAMVMPHSARRCSLTAHLSSSIVQAYRVVLQDLARNWFIWNTIDRD